MATAVLCLVAAAVTVGPTLHALISAARLARAGRCIRCQAPRSGCGCGPESTADVEVGMWSAGD